MNLASQAGEQQSDLLFVNFNQDYTSLSVGTRSGYKLYSLNSVDNLDCIYDSDQEEVYIVERLFSSSLVAVVSLSAPRKLKVCHFKKGTEICNYSYSNTILSVKLNRQRLVVCLEESLYIHNIRDMKVLHTIRDTPPNRNGLLALSCSNQTSYLAYPGSNQIGEVQIFDTINLRAMTMIAAHESSLAALAFNAQGSRLATASEKGTVIRVFSIPEGQKVFEFRRGMKRCATIHSMNFSNDGKHLCLSSNLETVHVFKLDMESKEKEKSTEEQQGLMGYFNQAVKTTAAYLPSQVTEVFHQWRSFSYAKVPSSGLGLKSVVALAKIQSIDRLLLASQDGSLYIFNFDPNEGGELSIIRNYRLDGQETEAAAPLPPGAVGEAVAQDRPLAHPAVSYASTARGDNQTAGGPSSDAQQFSDLEAETKQDSPELSRARLETLNLDDDKEFPPVSHKTD